MKDNIVRARRSEMGEENKTIFRKNRKSEWDLQYLDRSSF